MPDMASVQHAALLMPLANIAARSAYALKFTQSPEWTLPLSISLQLLSIEGKFPEGIEPT